MDQSPLASSCPLGFSVSVLAFLQLHLLAMVVLLEGNGDTFLYSGISVFQFC